jgi:hypothetical protein
MKIMNNDNQEIPWDIFVQSLDMIKNDITQERDNDIINQLKAVMDTDELRTMNITPEEISE